MTKQQERAFGFLLGAVVTSVSWSIFAYVDYKRGVREQEKMAAESRLLWTAIGIIRERVRRGDYDDLSGCVDREKAFEDLEFERIRVANDDLSDIILRD